MLRNPFGPIEHPIKQCFHHELLFDGRLLRAYERALSNGCGNGTGDEYGGGYESAREGHVTREHDDEDPYPVRPAGDTKIQPKADAGVSPIEYQADTNHKNREGEHVGGQLIHSSLRDTCQRSTQAVDVLSNMDVEHTPGRITESSYSGCNACLEITRAHVTTSPHRSAWLLAATIRP